MNNRERRFYLSPVDNRKSFYNKCYVVRDNNNNLTCYSYTTPVARFSEGKFARLWSGYSATTMRHINSFASYCGINASGKKWWDSLPIEYH